MPTKALTILAIDPGTRELGVAVLEGASLRYYGVKTIRGRKTAQQVLRAATEIAKRLIDEYRPDVLAIEKPVVIQKSAALAAVVADEIRLTAARKQLPVNEYAPATVRQFICRSGKATRSNAAKELAGRFFELARYQEHRSQTELLYYAHMFDAIAVGLTCHQDICKRAAIDNPSGRGREV
jgi:Holliday junction resolvasome RuvABC endonuclease subunit